MNPPRASVLLEAIEAAVSPTHAVGLPDNASAALFSLLERHPKVRLVRVTREGEAFAVAAGLWAGGKTPLVIVQNTGLLESGDALRGTAQRMGVPLVFVVTYRGYASAAERTPLPSAGPLVAEVLVDPRIDSVALFTEPTLEAWGIPRFSYGSDADVAQVAAAAARARRGASGGPPAHRGARMSGRLTKDELLAPLARLRGDAVVVTSMGVVRPWARFSTHPLDFASADSAMGHTADFALGLALARPERRVICLNGDGSTLMTLGTLVTIAEARPANLVLFVIVNGTYEITGNQAIPGATCVDFAGLARAAGVSRVRYFDDKEAYERALPALLEGDGPVVVVVNVEPGNEPPLERGLPGEPPYLRPSLAESTRRLRAALDGAR